MRLFIAIDLSKDMKKAMVGTMHTLKEQGVTGSYVPMANLHLTLAFIGETRETEKVKEVMRRIPVEKARLSFSEFGNFGDIFWIGIKGNQKIKKYVSDLRKALREAGIPCDSEKFEPHVTLIRRQKGKRPVGLQVPKEDMMITKVSLMKSEEKEGRRVYTEIFSV